MVEVREVPPRHPKHSPLACPAKDGHGKRVMVCFTMARLLWPDRCNIRRVFILLLKKMGQDPEHAGAGSRGGGAGGTQE